MYDSRVEEVIIKLARLNDPDLRYLLQAHELNLLI